MYDDGLPPHRAYPAWTDEVLAIATTKPFILTDIRTIDSPRAEAQCPMHHTLQ